MPGVYGLVGPQPEENLRRMADAMQLFDHFIRDPAFHEARFGAGRTHTGQVGEPSSPRGMGDVAIWVEGEAYNLDSGSGGLAQALLVADAANNLIPFLATLDGYFCAVLYDRVRGTVRLITDRYGMRPLYWYHMGDRFAWGSDVKAILAAEGIDKRINPLGFDMFMDLGYLVADHTWFEHIRLMEPATILEYDIGRNQTTSVRYWNWSDIAPIELAFDEAVDAFAERFTDAVLRRFDPNEHIGITLSGGLDSRAILAAVATRYPDHAGHTLTFGIPGSEDLRIARQATEIAGWHHHFAPLTHADWLESRYQQVWITDGLIELTHLHGYEAIRDASGFMPVNLSGYAGDVIAGGGYLAKIPADTRLNTTDAGKFYGRWVHETALQSPFFDIAKGEPHLLMHRVRRFTNHGTINTLPWIHHRKPFFDNRLIEWIYGIPDTYRAENRLYAAALKRHFAPYFETIPWQKTGKPVGRLNPPGFPIRPLLKAVRLAKQMMGLAPRKQYTDYPAWIRQKETAGMLHDLLSAPDARYRMFTDDNLAERWLTPHVRFRIPDHTSKILRAATVEVYLRKALG